MAQRAPPLLLGASPRGTSAGAGSETVHAPPETGIACPAFSRRSARRRRRECAAASASSRRYFSTCSGCAAIQTSGRSDSKSASGDERAINKARTYANGSIVYRLALARMLKQIAAVSPPNSRR